METVDRASSAETKEPGLTRLYKISAAAALLNGILFLIALISLVSAVLQPAAQNGWIFPLQNNWLVVLFKLNAGYEAVQFNLLQKLNNIDIVILALVGITYLGLYPALRGASKIWRIIALVQPFLGILLFIATKNAGRSAVMGATLVMALVMLGSKIFDKRLAVLGIVASVLLLAGDFGTTPGVHSNMLAIFIAVGYVLMMIWYFIIGYRLLNLERIY
jgi:hypothetical protein